MAVKLQAKKAKTAKSATAIIVDRIVELRKQIAEVAPLQKELDNLTKDLRTQAMEQDPDQVVSFEGTDHMVVFGEAAHTRSLTDVIGAKKALGNDTFFEIAKVTLGDLDKYLTAEELAPLIEEGRGARKIDVVEK